MISDKNLHHQQIIYLKENQKMFKKVNFNPEKIKKEEERI